MHIIVSGEGLTDMGRCEPAAGCCSGDQYQFGAMAVFVDQLINKWLDDNLNYELSHLESHMVTFVSENHLAENKRPPKSKKSMSLRGKGNPPETRYFYENARALAHFAKQKSEALNDKVVAVLFHDADGTASAGRGMWKSKWDSMTNGFEAEEFSDYGVPMLPMPKSEAWLLCALKNNYQHCNGLENESGNDKVDNSLKHQLEERLTALDATDTVTELVQSGHIDVLQINMNSFNKFKQQLFTAVENAQRQ